MNRSGYSYDCDDYWQLWKGTVDMAIRGKRGQAFLREMRDALDALPVKRLIDGDLEADGEFCAIGAVGRLRGIDMSTIDPYNHIAIAKTFGIANALAREIEYENDEAAACWGIEETPERRFERIRRWVERNIKGMD